MELHKAIFLDRDETINLDPGYIREPSRVEIYPGVVESLKYLKEKYHYKLIVISNQSGIARGLLSDADVIAVNSRVNEFFEKEGVSIDAFYYCPYHPDFSLPKDVACRKPSPTMLLDAAKKDNIDLSSSYMIGDKESDILAGINAGVRTIMIKHNHTTKEINLLTSKADFKTNNFNSIKDYIIKTTNLKSPLTQ